MPEILLDAEPKQQQRMLRLEIAERPKEADLMVDLGLEEGPPERWTADRRTEELEPGASDVGQRVRLGL